MIDRRLTPEIYKQDWLARFLDKIGLTTILICAVTIGAFSEYLSSLALIVFASIGSLLLVGLIVTYIAVLLTTTWDEPDDGYPGS